MKLVLTEIDFAVNEEVYNKAKRGLTKYMREGTNQSPATVPIKLEKLTAADQEALIARGWGKGRPTE